MTQQKIQELLRGQYLPAKCYDGTCDHWVHAQYRDMARRAAPQIEERDYAIIWHNVSRYSAMQRVRLTMIWHNEDGNLTWDCVAPLTPTGARHYIDIWEHLHGYARHDWVERLRDPEAIMDSLAHASYAAARACADAKRNVRSDWERRSTIAYLRHTTTDYDDIDKRRMSDEEVAQLRRDYNVNTNAYVR